MGKGSPKHEEVINYLKKRYPKGSANEKLLVFDKTVYGESHPDYVTKDGAIIEVVWTEHHHPIFGKIVAWLNYIKKHPKYKEVWIVSNCRAKSKTEDECISWQNTYRELEKMCKCVLLPKYHNKIKFFDYDKNPKPKLKKI